MQKTLVSILISLLVFTATAALAQNGQLGGGPLPSTPPAFSAGAGLDVTASAIQLPLITPDLALQILTQRTAAQAEKLTGYTDTTIVAAELPDSSQKGEYELIRSYTAPNSLNFATVKFTGDSFVKTNVIVRLLQQEVDHVVKGDPAATAITEQNYKFHYKGLENVDSNLCHVFQLKPRKKLPGLFKGKIFVDAYSASLRRAEGSIKSPSFFVKNIDFVQDFVDVGGFTFPEKMRSTAKARIVGRAVVSVIHRGYKLEAKAAAASVMPALVNTQVGASH